MWIELILRLSLAHLLADFFFQNDYWCKQKLEKRFACWHTYAHALIVVGLSWIALWSWSAWWVAVLIGCSHWIIDCLKTKDGLVSFVVDQIAHIVCMLLFVKLYEHCSTCLNRMPENLFSVVLFFLVALCNAKPANILIKHILSHYSVKTPVEDNQVGTEMGKFQSGALIGSIERWLIIIFIYLNHYEAIGFLLAAKSIIRFRDTDTTKTEYVLAGTFVSVLIAVVSGLMLVSISAV